MVNDLKKIEIQNLIVDYNKCDYYLGKLDDGYISYLQEAIIFCNKKYIEFSTKDAYVVLSNTNFVPTDLSTFSQTMQNLEALKNMIREILAKNCEFS